ncbi:MAG TPA: hypothetical protein VGA15_21065 [Bradyrhizobium sp.]
MTNIVAITAANARRWQVAKIAPNRLVEVSRVAKRLTAPAAKFRYQGVSQAVWGTPDRWPVVAVIHEPVGRISPTGPRKARPDDKLRRNPPPWLNP